MKREVIRSLTREKAISSVAIEHLEALIGAYEEKYGWTTEEFIQKFEGGVVGDEEDFFKWYALAQALRDWQATKSALEEILAD